MDKRIFKTFLLFILLDLLPNVISGGWFCNNPSPPVCADDCDGNGYYVSPDGTACIPCPQCSAGQELNKDCGNGLNGDAVCIPCLEGFFSLSTSQRCTQCTTCTNTVEQETCQLTQNRVCGDCLPGFFRGSDRFSTDFNACPNRCSDLPRDTPQCGDWWSTQDRESIEVEQPTEIADVRRLPEEVSLDDIDPCEPKTPLCIDPCHDGNFFLDYDGLCKACLSCQPGEELNKVCGRGKNGDAYCRRCPEGTFSEDGLQRCSPCRICVNTLATECTASRNTACGECLPGYYQDADGYFPDQGACPNKCPECPNTVPQCQEWCESRTNPDKVTVDPAESVGQDDVTLADVAVDIPQSGADDGINDEANPPPASHGSYMLIFTVLASLLAVVIIVLITVLFVFRCLWKRSNAPTPSLLPSSSATSSPTSSPSRTPPTVYEPTTFQYSPEGDGRELWNFMSTTFKNLTGSRPVSGGSTDAENESSAVSTPTMNLGRRLAERDLLRHMVRQVGVDHDDSPRLTTPKPPKHHDTVTEERMVNSAGSMNQSVAARQYDRDIEDSSRPRAPSSGKVVTERASGTVHPHVDDTDEAPRTRVRRRSIISNNSQDEQFLPLLNNNRRSSLSDLFLVTGNNRQKLWNGRNGNTAPVKEAEAALRPTDSSSDNAPTADDPVDTNNTKSANPKQPSQSLEPNASSHKTPTAAAATVLPKEIPVENSTHKNPAAIPDDQGSIGNKSPRDTNFTINITMNTKEVETVHIGDVHNKRNFRDGPYQGIKASEPNNIDDNGEAQKLLNVNMSASETDTLHVDSSDHDDDDNAERDKLLDPKSS
ncbi:uncharacterized protein LOC115920696 [Strongylocentrotus purpuratus]|uniref:TNFR-Cys domain-containing protein n=1 Tax=Strongylocentrotus purpuratus TaxID=7668 RepID=A0A7M7N966_STRPU|nr:uncharacterized protein LOC115920696 [Strongylocentrotus purpuratus]